MTAAPPFAVGGDPTVNPSAYRVTAFASGLTYPKGMTTLPDGSLLVGADVPGTTNYYDPDSKGEIVRFADTNNDGVADDAGTVLYTGLPGQVVAVKQAGGEILALSSLGGHEQIAFLKIGATPTSPLTLENTLSFSYAIPNWEHTTFELAVRPSLTAANKYDVLFNIGSEFNGVTKDNQGHIVPEPTTGKVGWSGIINNSGEPGDAIYDMTLTDNQGVPSVSGVSQVATGLRNAASMVFDPVTGDLIIADNGIDGIPDANEAWSADTLERIPAAMVGNTIVNFGFPYTYYRTTDTPGGQSTLVNPNPNVPTPLYHFDPLVDTNLPTTGSESEGAAGIALAPKNFPGPLSNGVFVGFHGLFNTGGTTNEENPVVFASFSSQHYFDFLSNDLPNIGHIDGATSTDSTLYLSDISSNGDVFGSGGSMGMIYAISSIYKPPVLAPIQSVTVNAGSPVQFIATATDPNVGGNISFSLAPGAPSDATIDPHTGAFHFVPNNGPATIPITVVATDSLSQINATQTFVVTVQIVAPPPSPPMLAAIPPVTVNEGSPVTFQATATDPNPGAILTYSLAAGAPAGARINPQTGAFSYVPLRAPAATTITVVVTDQLALSDQKSFVITVQNVAPIIAPIPSVTTAFSVPIQVNGAFFDPGTLDTWTGSVNYGDGTPTTSVTINANRTFQLNHLYNAPGSFIVSVAVTDNSGGQGTRRFLVRSIEPIPSSFTYPGHSQPAVFRVSTAEWFALGGNGVGQALGSFGATNGFDIPVAGNYAGTGATQLGVFRPSTAQWFAQTPGAPGQVLSPFGATQLADIPISGDFLGLGYDQQGVFRVSTAEWYVKGPNGTVDLGAFGATGLFDIPVPGDYDGIGRTEVAVFRPSTAQWFVLRPGGGALLATFGATGLFDLPVPGNYDGNGKTEVAVFRPSTAQWFVLRPNGGALLTTFGATNLVDVPTETPFGALLALGMIGGGIHNHATTATAGGLPNPGGTTSDASPHNASSGITSTSTVYARPSSTKIAAQNGIGSTADTQRAKVVLGIGTGTPAAKKPISWNSHRFGRFRRTTH